MTASGIDVVPRIEDSARRVCSPRAGNQAGSAQRRHARTDSDSSPGNGGPVRDPATVCARLIGAPAATMRRSRFTGRSGTPRKLSSVLKSEEADDGR